ncbi:CRP-like cAMP-binding protein [Methylobacterium sp. PvP062]|uniref:CRP-like cAMP-binding protein n=1 Tax=Methylobacterium radiotolerans TaxID=31998 RepID=A0ABV2NSE6_9HYPH|nr:MULTISPECIES: Crp/Fnr family transcriptional regulator [Methylobacterium]MBP2498651.1 CRP-like cAMP-binding protein [Methylobacterium sp. PvP105]MBP2506063.1 CRP-like cAMP-binding protein [Methylobacterium sp. PvP109]MCX7336439.1 Crp/Fnr family transcriptional regulator [Hyphomicrobiales bacterium]UIY45018.1 Crp/Fnr family transcriptional regulator [Methylobacterium radiotolerans]
MPSSFGHHGIDVLIRKLESIGTLSEEERQAIQSLPMRIHILGARQDIVRDGEQPTQCCLILDGWVCRYKLLSQGKRQILSFHIAGDMPDLQGLHAHTMDYGLSTVKHATVAFIARESLRELTARFPSVATLLWRDTLLDAAVVRAWMTGMGRRTAFERIGHLFCELYLKLRAVGLAGDYRCPLPVTQMDLADALGLTPVHINRVLREMRSRALITLRHQTLVIEAWDDLLQASEFDPTYLYLEMRAAA